MRTSKYTNEEDFHCLEDLREISSELSLIHFGKEICKPYHVFAGERDEYIIHFILSGHGFYTSNQNTWTLSAGQMFLIRPHQPVVYCADSKDPWHYAWIGFKGSRTETLLSKCGFSKSRLTLSAPASSDFLPLFDEMFAHVSLDYDDILFRESVLLRLFSVLCRHAASIAPLLGTDTEEETRNPYVAQAVDYINVNYMHSITVADIAEQIGISRTYLNRLFQLEYSLPVQEFLMNFRMQKAASFLVNTNMPVKEIAQNLGYHDPLVFSKAFKKRFDVSPKNYRLIKEDLEVRAKRPPE